MEKGRHRIPAGWTVKCGSWTSPAAARLATYGSAGGYPGTLAFVVGGGDRLLLIVQAGGGGGLRHTAIWDVEHCAVVHEFDGWAAAASPDGRLVAVAHPPTSVTAYRVAGGGRLPEPLVTVVTRVPAGVVSISAGGRTLAAGGTAFLGPFSGGDVDMGPSYGCDTVQVWDLAAGRELHQRRFEWRCRWPGDDGRGGGSGDGWCPNPLFSPDNRLLVRGSGIWDLASGKAVPHGPTAEAERGGCAWPPSAEGWRALAFAPDGAALAAEVRGGLQFLEPRTGRTLLAVRDLDFGRSPWAAAFSADGRLFAVAGGGDPPIRLVRAPER